MIEVGNRVQHAVLGHTGTVKRRADGLWNVYVVVAWDRADVQLGYVHQDELKKAHRGYRRMALPSPDVAPGTAIAASSTLRMR